MIRMGLPQVVQRVVVKEMLFGHHHTMKQAQQSSGHVSAKRRNQQTQPTLQLLHAQMFHAFSRVLRGCVCVCVRVCVRLQGDHPYDQQTRRYSRSCLDLTRGNAPCWATPSAPAKSTSERSFLTHQHNLVFPTWYFRKSFHRRSLRLPNHITQKQTLEHYGTDRRRNSVISHLPSGARERW